MADYITFTDFAERAGISRQAIRKNKKLAPYILDEPGKQLMIDSAALAIYGETEPKPNGNQNETEPKPDENQSETEPQPKRNQDETAATIAALQAAMEILREQLAAKDAIIADKDAQIRTMSDRLADLAARGNEIADKSIVALQQRHMLDAAEMQQAAEQPGERQPWWKRIGKKT